MKKIAPYIIFISLGLFAVWIWRGCSGVSTEQQLDDSIKREKALNDSIKIVRNQAIVVIDSISNKHTRDSSFYVKKIDSLTKIVKSWQAKFNVTKDSIGTLYANLKTFYRDHDTVALVNTYNMLNDQLTEANNMLFQLQLSRDSVDNAKDSEIARLRGVIVELQGQLATFNTLLTQAVDSNARMASTAQKAINKAKKANLLAKIGGGIAIVLAAIVIL